MGTKVNVTAEEMARAIAEAAVDELNASGNYALTLPDICRPRITGTLFAGDLIVTVTIPLQSDEPAPPPRKRQPPRRAG